MARTLSAKTRRRQTTHGGAPQRHRVASASVAGSRKLLVSFEYEDLEWLDVTVSTLKGTRRRTTKSEIVRVGLKLLKEKPPAELKNLLRDLD